MFGKTIDMHARPFAWALGGAGSVALALLLVVQTWLGSAPAQATSVATHAAIIPEGRTDYCAAPPALTTAKPVVSIAVSDDGDANKVKPAQTIFAASSPSSTPVVVTLKDIQNALAALSPSQASLLTEQIVNGKHIWTLNMHLQMGRTTTLRIAGGATGAAMGAQVDELRLRSDPSPGYPIADPNNPTKLIYDYTTFAALRGRNGSLFIENTKITSWDSAANAVDSNYADGRAFILVREAASMSVCSSEIAYLGFAGGQAYGLSWRDTGSANGALRTRVTGDMVNSLSHHNYYGVYTFQAKNMIFRGNKFYDNAQYGFDPHDYTTDVLVENNEAYHNGNHGFIISRGCTNFVFRQNLSHDNIVKAGSKNPSAHGFMLDPGSPSAGTQSPSTNNVYENNKAYNNDGYGFRILDSDNNTFTGNEFYGNRLGFSVEGGSTGNVFDGNTVRDNLGQKITDANGNSLKGGYGFHIYGASDDNTITNNIITGNATVGVALKTGGNLVQGNTITGNGAPDPLYSPKQFEGVSVSVDTEPAPTPEQAGRGSADDASIMPDENLPADDYIMPSENTTQAAPTIQAITAPNANQILNNTISTNATNGITLKGAGDTLIKGNTIESNATDGVSISADSTSTQVTGNTIRANGIYGVEVAGTVGTKFNTVSKNSITGNGSDGISVRDGANEGIAKPLISIIGATTTVSGTAKPGALIEVFTDNGDEGQFFEGTTTANASTGSFRFTFASAPQAAFVVVTQTDGNGNTSPFSSSKQIGTIPTATPTTPTATATPETPTPTTPTPTTPTPETPTPTTPTPEAPKDNPTLPGTTIYLPVVRNESS